MGKSSELDRRIRKHRLQVLLAELWGAKWIIAIAALILAGLAAYASQPFISDGPVTGRIESSFAPASKYPQNRRLVVDVALDGGGRAVFSLPSDTPYRSGASVELIAFHNAWGIRAYRFVRYADGA